MTTPVDLELNDLVEEFDLLGDWEERYRHLIDLGRKLAALSPEERTDGNKVLGCASQVWLVTASPSPERLTIRGDSDSDLVRGLIAVLIRLFSDRTPEDILAFDIKGAFEALGFSGAISSQRSNGFFSMVQRVRREAEAVRA